MLPRIRARTGPEPPMFEGKWPSGSSPPDTLLPPGHPGGGQEKQKALNAAGKYAQHTSENFTNTWVSQRPATYFQNMHLADAKSHISTDVPTHAKAQ